MNLKRKKGNFVDIIDIDKNQLWLILNAAKEPLKTSPLSSLNQRLIELVDEIQELIDASVS